MERRISGNTNGLNKIVSEEFTANVSLQKQLLPEDFTIQQFVEFKVDRYFLTSAQIRIVRLTATPIVRADVSGRYGRKRVNTGFGPE
jgi:hypothetical protein